MEQRGQNELHNEKMDGRMDGVKNNEMFQLLKEILNWSEIKIIGRTERECESHFQNLILGIHSALNATGTLSDTDMEKVQLQKQIFNWSVVKINGRTERECESHFQNLMRRIRNVLNPMETLSDTDIEKVAAEQVRKRQTTYPNRDRRKTSIADTPLQLFIEHRRDMGETNFQHRLRRKYNELEDTEKLKWIKMAINKKQKSGNILNSEELRIFRGEPKKPLDALGFFNLQNGRIRKIALGKKAYKRLTSVDKADDGGEQPNTPMKRRRVELNSKLQTSQSNMQPTKEYRLIDELARITSSLPRIIESLIQLLTDLKSLSDNAQAEFEANIHQNEVRQAKLEKNKQEDEHVVDVGEQSTTTQRELSSKLQTSQSTEKPGKRAPLMDVRELEAEAAAEVNEAAEVSEPQRIPSVRYNYFKNFLYDVNGKGAKRTYLMLSGEEKERICKQHKRKYNSYCKKLSTYLDSLTTNEAKEFHARIQAEEQNDSSDPDDD